MRINRDKYDLPVLNVFYILCVNNTEQKLNSAGIWNVPVVEKFLPSRQKAGIIYWLVLMIDYFFL
jgi:hypothetical protein